MRKCCRSRCYYCKKIFTELLDRKGVIIIVCIYAVNDADVTWIIDRVLATDTSIKSVVSHFL